MAVSLVAGAPTACSVLLALGFAPAAAQDAAASAPGATAALPGVVITGTRLPLTPSAMSQTITIVDDAELQITDPASIEEVLSRVLAFSSIVSGPADSRRCTCVARSRATS